MEDHTMWSHNEYVFLAIWSETIFENMLHLFLF